MGASATSPTARYSPRSSPPANAMRKALTAEKANCRRWHGPTCWEGQPGVRPCLNPRSAQRIRVGHAAGYGPRTPRSDPTETNVRNGRTKRIKYGCRSGNDRTAHPRIKDSTARNREPAATATAHIAPKTHPPTSRSRPAPDTPNPNSSPSPHRSSSNAPRSTTEHTRTPSHDRPRRDAARPSPRAADLPASTAQAEARSSAHHAPAARLGLMATRNGDGVTHARQHGERPARSSSDTTLTRSPRSSTRYAEEPTA